MFTSSENGRGESQLKNKLLVLVAVLLVLASPVMAAYSVQLKAGWNLLGNLNVSKMNLSDIGVMLGANVTTVAGWNMTNQSWVTYPINLTMNGEYNVSRGAAFIAYSRQNFTVDLPNISSTFTIEAVKGWNLFTSVNSSVNFTFKGFATRTSFLNRTRTMALLNVSGNSSRYVTFVHNKSVNNATEVGYGVGFWARFNQSVNVSVS